MKPSKIRRGIQSRHSRSAGDLPNIGRVSRLRDSEGPAKSMRWVRPGSRHRGGASHRGGANLAGRRQAVLLWSMVLVVATTLLLGGFIWYWLKSRGGAPQVEAAQIRPGSERIVSQFASPGEDEALGLVKRAIGSRNPAAVESHFRMGGAQSDEIIGFLGKSDERDGKLDRMQWLGSMDTADSLIEGVLVSYHGVETPVDRIAFLVPDDKGVWKVDFDSFARTARPSWKDLLERRAERSIVRVFVAEDSYYNGPFTDESEWRCFAMASPETRETFPEEQDLLRGYCKVGSPQAAALAQIFAGDDFMSRVTLEIRRVDGADARQFEITRVLAPEWVVGSKAFDERFD